MSKLTEMLDKYRKGESVRLKVGIMADKTYPDGQKVAFVGYVNEYGYDGMIPGREGKIYHAVGNDGNLTKGGRFVKKNKSNLERTVTIPAYKLSIPARPFFRTAIANNKEILPKMAAALLKKHGQEEAVRMIGEHMVGQLSESVMTWSEPPNAQSTIRAKGYNAPLRGEDRLLRKSFSYEIEK